MTIEVIKERLDSLRANLKKVEQTFYKIQGQIEAYEDLGTELYNAAQATVVKDNGELERKSPKKTVGKATVK